MIIGESSFALIFSLLIAVTLSRYLVYRRRRKILLKEDEKLHEFIKSFDPSSFTDFSLLSFRSGAESLIAPFPSKEDRDWRYTIYLSRVEIEDLTTIAHEITECTIGRLIERLLGLDKPLYIDRKENDKFWIHGKNRRYLLEHAVTTFSEIGQVENEKLKERFSKEDFEEFTK
jgi:hypothetical protein